MNPLKTNTLENQLYYFVVVPHSQTSKNTMVPADIYRCGVNSILMDPKTRQNLDFYFFGDRHIPPDRCHPYHHLIPGLPKKTHKFAAVYRNGEPCKYQVTVKAARKYGAYVLKGHN